MRIYEYATMTDEDRRTVLGRSTADIFSRENLDGVRAIMEDVRRDGDLALVRALERFDRVSITPEEIAIAPEEIEEARRTVPRPVQDAVATAIDAVRRYNERLLQGSSWLEELAPGVVLGEKRTPIDRVGLYVPCGKGSFPSVLVHIATPALVADVREIAVVLPPLAGQGKAVDPAVLVVADQLGLQEIYRANGPAGVAALALGTETIRNVRKIAGPGSPAVQATQLLARLVGGGGGGVYGPPGGLFLADDS